MESYLEKIYFENSVKEYLIVAGGIVVGMAILRIFNKIVFSRIKKWAKKTTTKTDDYIVNGIDRFALPMLNTSVFYLGIQYLKLTPWLTKTLHIAFTAVLTYYAVKLITDFIRIFLASYIRTKEGGKEEDKIKQLQGILIIINFMIWSLGIIFLLDNFGYDITAIITGLGIGGLAIALAAQNILGDLFNYFVIFFDRPFEIGDFIVVDDKSGNVEYIGIKTTRIKSLSGEQIIISNTNLNNSRLHNFKRMKERRVNFVLGVTYQTSAKKLREIPEIIRTIIEQQEGARIDRSHFFSYGDFSLNFETVYYVENPDYARYMEVHQSINFKIFEVFEEQKIEFAYPTQTLYVEKNKTL